MWVKEIILTLLKKKIKNFNRKIIKIKLNLKNKIDIKSFKIILNITKLI